MVVLQSIWIISPSHPGKEGTRGIANARIAGRVVSVPTGGRQGSRTPRTVASGWQSSSCGQHCTIVVVGAGRHIAQSFREFVETGRGIVRHGDTAVVSIQLQLQGAGSVVKGAIDRKTRTVVHVVGSFQDGFVRQDMIASSETQACQIQVVAKETAAAGWFRLSAGAFAVARNAVGSGAAFAGTIHGQGIVKGARYVSVEG